VIARPSASRLDRAVSFRPKRKIWLNPFRRIRATELKGGQGLSPRIGRMSQQPEANMSEPPSAAPRRPMRSVRVADIPALFSEGPEPEPSRPAQVRWPAVGLMKLRLLKLVPRALRRDAPSAQTQLPV